MKKIAFIVAATALTFAWGVTAQDYSLSPAYGTVALTSGFTPDPHTTAIQAGGSINAAQATALAGRGCVGNIADAPDLRLNFTAGSGSLPLIFRVRSQADTTLVINAPDGSWHCNDDTEGLHPVVRFDSPPSGQYDIWVGTYQSEMAPSTLHITELTTVPPL